MLFRILLHTSFLARRKFSKKTCVGMWHFIKGHCRKLFPLKITNIVVHVRKKPTHTCSIPEKRAVNFPTFPQEDDNIEPGM